MFTVQFKKIHPDAKDLLHSHEWDAGYNIFSIESKILQPGERHAFKTWICMTFEKWYYTRVAPRSWMAVRHGIDVLAWVIDHDYTGEYLIVLINSGQEPYEVLSWDKIAQIVFEKCHYPVFEEVEEMDAKSRGESGIGSTWR
jgi:dUTP pyrophosphatase